MASGAPNPTCLILASHHNLIPNKSTIKATLLPHQNPDRRFTITSKLSPWRDTAIVSAFLSTMASDPAVAIQQVAEVAPEGDNRFLAILIPIIPAILWVLYNILGPALNQIERMRSEKGIVVGLGIGGSAALHFLNVPDASATETDAICEVARDDNMSLLVLVLFVLLFTGPTTSYLNLSSTRLNLLSFRN